MKYCFDENTDRIGTHSFKLDRLPEGAPEDSLSLWVADMDFPCSDSILDALHSRIDRKIFGYTDYENAELKSSVTAWFKRRFNWEIDADTVFFSPGVVPAFAMLINILTEEGDGVIIQKPVYYPFSKKIESNKRRLSNNPLIYADGKYQIDFKNLEVQIADPINKGILFCSPHNPVGRVWSHNELRRLVDICKKHDKWIISDEIHCDLTRKGVQHWPLLKIAPDYKERIIACTAPSKTFNLAGMQISNIVIPNKEYQEKWKNLIGDRLGMNMCNPFGLVATIAAYNDSEDWLEQVKDYIDGNITYLRSFIEENFPKAMVADTQGTYLMWVDFNAYCADHRKLEHWMHNKAKIALDEGYIFGDEGKGFERINVASPRKTIEECMARMKNSFDHLLAAAGI